MLKKLLKSSITKLVIFEIRKESSGGICVETAIAGESGMVLRSEIELADILDKWLLEVGVGVVEALMPYKCVEEFYADKNFIIFRVRLWHRLGFGTWVTDLTVKSLGSKNMLK